MHDAPVFESAASRGLAGLVLVVFLAAGAPPALASGPEEPAEPVSDGSAPGAPRGLVWPTDSGRCVTASFCEFRPGHFHSGIDISTWGKVGYRSLAVADGEIVRAKVTCGGYGRAVYLRLEDGRTVVYAHLSRFAGALADTVRARQMEAADAYLDVDFPPGTFPVRGGDLVAWTGQSGVGVPHLHVEIRDDTGRPLDPLRSGLGVADGLAPVVLRIALTPLDPASSVDGRPETVILDVHPTDSPERGIVPRTIPVEGEIGIAIEVDETTNACRFRLAPSRLELREGGNELYSVDYRGFSFGETRDQDFQIDPRFSYTKVGRFHALWRRPGNRLTFLADPGGTGGVLRAGRGPAEERQSRRAVGEAESGDGYALRGSVQRGEARVRTFTIIAQDAAGNRGAAEITLSFAAPPEIAALSVRLVGEGERGEYGEDGEDGGDGVDLGVAWSDTLEIVGAVREGGRSLEAVELEWSPDAGMTWLGTKPATFSPDGSFRSRLPLAGRVPGEGPRQIVVRAQARDRLGAVGLARSEAPEGSEFPERSAPAPEIVTLGGWVELRYDGTVPWSALSGGWEALPGGEEEAAVLVRPLGRGVRIVLDARPPLGEPRVWSGLGREWKGIDPWGRPVPLSFDLPEVIAPDRPGVAAAPGGLLAVSFPAGTVREAAFVLVREEPSGSPEAFPELTPVGPRFVIDAGAVPFADEWTVEIRSPADSGHDPARMGIFVQENGRPRWLGADRAGDGWTASARTVLPVGLFEDVVPPRLGEPRLEEKYGEVRLLFLAEDRGAGLDCDAVEVRLDGTPLAHELDDETGDVVALVPLPAKPGEGGVFTLRAVDRCGNAATRTVEVRVP